MPKDWLLRVDHVLEAITEIEGDVEGLSFEEFERDRTKQRSVFWSLQVIGEAIRSLPEDFRDRYPDVEWRAIRGMRNVMVHQYHAIQLDTVWDAVHSGLPVLKTQMLELRADIERGGEGSHP